MKTIAAFVAASLLAMDCGACALPSERVEVQESLQFDAGSRLTLDLFAPAQGTDRRALVVVVGGPIGEQSGRRDAALRALCNELAAGGVAAALVDWRAGLDVGRGDLRAALSFLRTSEAAGRVDPKRISLHAYAQGVQPALDVTMEENAGCALSLHAGAGVVIEGLRGDLPMLVVVDSADPPRTRRGLQELALQAELAGMPLRLEPAARADASSRVVRFHLDRLLEPPGDPGTIEDPERALAIATLFAERGDEAGFFEWLERAEELGFEDAERLRNDGSLVRLRSTPRFRGWIAAHATSARARLCRDFEPGRRITIDARFVESDGKTPVAGAQVYLYQTDRAGLYVHGEGSDEQPRLYAYARTDARGCIQVETIEPGGYPRTMIPAHIHVVVEAAGRRPRALEFVFDGDPRMVESGRERAQRLGWPIVVLRESEGAVVGEALVVLR